MALADQRARERRDDQALGIRTRLSVFCAPDAQDIPCVLDQYVLEAASGGDQRDHSFTRGRDGGKSAVHAPVRAGGSDPEACIPPREVVGRWNAIRRDPFPLDAGMIEARFERPVRLVVRLAVADDTDEHRATLDQRSRITGLAQTQRTRFWPKSSKSWTRWRSRRRPRRDR